MIPHSMLGRYEFSDGSSNKFWTINDVGGGDYAATWGRIGTAGQGPKVYTEAEAYQKINEKISKGYQRVDDHLVPRKEAADRVGAKRAERKTAINFMEELRKVK
jgi:predicted DNA-binding WGR domain protein